MDSTTIPGITLLFIGIILMISEKIKFFENLKERISPKWKKIRSAVTYLKRKGSTILSIAGFILIMIGLKPWLTDHSTEIIQLSAPTSVVLFILSRWWEEKKEFRRIRDALCNEMAQNERMIQRNLEIIRKGRDGSTGTMHAHPFPLFYLNDFAWKLILTSGKSAKLKGKTKGGDILSDIGDMYAQVDLINQVIAARPPILFGPLRMSEKNIGGRMVSYAAIDLNAADSIIEGNLIELEKKISEINKELL